ncbi:MAG TPA: undecaprenyl-diphosphate phosphatase [Candidatus Blautia stercoravium]|nr:undecaprenyl-diphosphate phosphatase [Candidatus Blautia stercoravium]
MSLIEALLLGLVQGLTEFLPVSSSGHLAILNNLLKIKETGLIFPVLLHAGTLAALFIAFRQDVKKLLLEGCKTVYDLLENVKIYFKNRHEQEAIRYKKLISNNYRKLLLLLLVSTLPTVFEGMLFQNLVQQAESNLLAPAVGLFITGIFLMIVDFFPAGKKIPKDVGYGTAFLIGIFQGIAVFPGISRLGLTLAVCLMCGFNRKFAVKYAFLTALPTILGATVWELIQLPGSKISAGTLGIYMAGAVIAGVIGCFCIPVMLQLVRKKKFSFFAGYCFLIGAVAAVCNFVL